LPGLLRRRGRLLDEITKDLQTLFELPEILLEFGERAAHASEVLLARQFHDALGRLGDIDLRGYIRDIEVALIEAALDTRQGNVAQAADALRLRRTTLIEKMKKFGIRRGLVA
jgi:DNA-binding NtrC family response regulator